MIDRISSVSAPLGANGGSPASDAAAAVARAISAALTAGNPIGTPLRQIAGEAAGGLTSALGRSGDAVAGGQLEQASLDFGREVKALAISRPDLGAQQISERIDAAVGHAAAAASVLPAAFDPVDRATALFEGAARYLSEDGQS